MLSLFNGKEEGRGGHAGISENVEEDLSLALSVARDSKDL